jgi:2-polyprenyl-3-methyl-5-hydroxy-6-metoxy-1,4-benzoquinol methylase
MGLFMYLCPVKFRFVRRRLSATNLRILDVGCGNNSPTTTKRWFPNSHYDGADIQWYNNSDADQKAMDGFYLLGIDGAGYSEIPNDTYDFIIINHVIEHTNNSDFILPTLCTKLKPGGYIWIAFPSLTSLCLPSADGTLQFCDDPTHIYVPDIRTVSNVLLSSGVKVLHAGRSRDFIRWLIGATLLPWKLVLKLTTGRFSSRGLWLVMGFEDHVFGQRKS